MALCASNPRKQGADLDVVLVGANRREPAARGELDGSPPATFRLTGVTEAEPTSESPTHLPEAVMPWSADVRTDPIVQADPCRQNPQSEGGMTELTALLASARQGDERAAGQAFTLLYDDLRRLARSRLRQHQTMTLLDTTSLVHESYLRLVGNASLDIENRHHFFAYAARVMRSVIVDFARARQAERRGGDAEHVVIDTALSNKLAMPENDVLRVHEALEVLGQADKRLAQIVEMRYFAGMTEVEIAEVLGLSDRTVRRSWEKARLLLIAALE